VAHSRKLLGSITESFKSLIGVLDALETIFLIFLLFFFSCAVLSSPYVLARELFQGALIVPAALLIVIAVACIVALAVAWAHRGLRWWYFILLIVASGAITELGRSYFGK
jgi:hypothetical protein